jgi:HSP20 family protein
MLMSRPLSLWNEWNQQHGAMTRLAYAPAWRAFAPSFPPVNVWQDDEAVYATAELPGLGPEDVEVFVSRGAELTIRGRRKADDLPEGTWYLRERGFGSFQRTLELPSPVGADQVEARFVNGVLQVKLPRAASARPKRIPVRRESAPALGHTPATEKGGQS